MTNVQLKAGNVPNLRFPGFEGEWERKRLEVFIDIISGIPIPSQDILDKEKGTRILRGINITEGFIRHNKEIDRYYDQPITDKIQKFLLAEKDLVLGMDGSKVGKNVALISKADVGSILIQRVARIKALENTYIDFIFQRIYSDEFQSYVDAVNTSSGIPHISLQQIKDFTTYFPESLFEQKKIASLLSVIDERISTQNKIIEDLKFLKNIVRYDIFTKITNEATKFKHIKDILNYEQPGKYLVTNTDYYTDDSLIPVLTANKTFILGFTTENFGIYDKGECIIFDDFTMDLKFVNFPFKVKSSAIKILTAKNEGTLKFIFEYLFFLNLSSGEHKRHYISEVELLQIVWPDYHKQNQITNILSSIDGKLKNEIKIYKLLTEQKQYFLTELFI